MAVRRGTYVRKDATAGTSPQDARLAVAGLVTASGDLGVVPGVLSGCTVTGMAAWTYSVAAGHFVTTRGASDGAVLGSVDGATTTGAVAAAPGTGSRWDLIWVRQRDVDNGDADSQAVVGVTQGVSGGSPTKPYGSVPAGALVVAEAQVAAGATQTSHANVTITQIAAPVAARGGVIACASAAARDRLLPYATTAQPILAEVGRVIYRTTGSSWVAIAGPTSYLTAVGGIGPVTADTQITAQGVTAPGFPYRVQVDAQVRVDLSGGAADYVLEIRHAATGQLAVSPTTLDRCEVRQVGGTLRCRGIYEAPSGVGRDFGMYLARSAGAGTGSVTNSASVNRLDLLITPL